MTIPLSSVDLSATERAHVEAAISGGWLSGTGPFVRTFEQRLGQRIGRRHVVAVANGTLAIELVLRALDIGPGDDVIVPALTFAAPASSVLAVGATPVLADVSAESWTLSPDSAARMLTPRTRAILAVDVLGHPADFDGLGAFGVPVIEDAAQAHGAQYRGRPVGSLGLASIFSFHANKTITTGEGGCVATDSDELADRMRLIANHGMHPDRPYVHEVVGRNHRMTSLAAAVGLGQLDRWDELVENRNRISREYDKLLSGTEFRPRPVAEWATYACWLHTVAAPNRSEVVAHLRAHGIDARAIWPALSTQPLFQPGRRSLPTAEVIANCAMWLPTYSGMTPDAVEFVATTAKQAIAKAQGE